MWTKIYFFVALVSASIAIASSPHKRAVGFAADPSINPKGLLNAAKKSKKVLATFPSGSGTKVKIFGDWLNLNGVSAFNFIADMDVDCDGVFSKCPHNPDGQPQTSFGRLDARKVPWFVIPQSFFAKHKNQIRPNSLGAILCNGKMFYAIFGDTDGDSPEVIGEASFLLAQTCFPKDGLDGGTGHGKADVLYIHFGNVMVPGVGDKTIDVAKLKAVGDQEVKKLAKALRV